MRAGTGATLLLCALLVLPLSARADMLENGSLFTLPPKIYATLGDAARANMKEAKISATEFVGEETKEQLKDPLLNDADRKRVIDRGVISTYAEWCGMDYVKASLGPFLAHEKTKKTWSEKQMAYIGVLHGATMGLLGKGIKDMGQCPAQMKTQLQKLTVNKTAK